jgi:hypothetical protein
MPAALHFDHKHMYALYAAGKHDVLSEEFLRVLRHFGSLVYLAEAGVPKDVNLFLKSFLSLFTQPDYVIPERHILAFILHNTLISNLVAISPFGTTDAFLELLRDQPSNFIKILTLYSARNRVHFERTMLFEANDKWASLWYNQFCAIYKSGLVCETVVENLRAHLLHQDAKLLPALGMADPYYGSSYVDAGLDKKCKPFLNNVVYKNLHFKAQKPADPKRIVVISDFWYKEHSVYRNYAAYVRELRKDYHVTLFYNLTPREKLDTAMFDEAIYLPMPNGRIPEEQLDGHFQLAYFPDVGMTEPSILLSNCRIAPIQICSPGHSVSTYGGQIDYFISGADVETPDKPEEHYSEQLVLLPGMGVIHNRPLYLPKGLKKKTTAIVINCPWAAHKTHARFLKTLRAIIEGSEAKLHLRIFPGAGTTQHNAHVAFARDVRAALGDKAVIDMRVGQPYEEYMQLMEEADFTLDAFHYAGCNGIADSLFLRKPTLVWEGDKWYNRIGPAMLRLVGMQEWIATNEAEFIAKALTLIHDTARREAVEAKLRKVDLDATIFSTEHAPSFARAVAGLIEHHEAYSKQGSKAPLVIS